jgi:deoxyribodipyrimidine photo-lyase
MSKIYKNSLFIFRRDLRLHDNTALIQALNNSHTVICCFIMTPTQLNDSNKFKSQNAIQFMHESLLELKNDIKNKDGKLFFFFDKPHYIISQFNIDAVFINADYTPYAIKRDNKIKNVCKNNNIIFHIFHDDLLNQIGTITTKNNSIYQKFTPFFNNVKKNKINEPIKNNFTNYYNGNIKKFTNKNNIKLSKLLDFYNTNHNINVNGGRKHALKILKNIHKWNNYNNNRDLLSYKTTNLSAYIKFGCISIREVFHYFKNNLNSNNALFKQLHWRDFYYNIAFQFPHVFKQSLKTDYDNIKWNNDISLFNKWKNGQTGFPIVDAGMRELNTTGFMHNRTRLITSNFLVKLLLINWQWGEKYFATKLVDYDPSVNNGNWQWSSGSGADSQPYFRIFNPWTQSIKFDPHCLYIKKWIPELNNVPNNDIHKWFDKYQDYHVYLQPCIDYQKNRLKTIQIYKMALN